ASVARSAPAAWSGQRTARVSIGIAQASTRVARHGSPTIMVCPRAHSAASSAASCYVAARAEMACSGDAAPIRNALTPGLTPMANRISAKPPNKEYPVTVKLPRLKIAKSTRATISGILIAIACLYVLAMAYDEARDNLLRFFISTLLLVVIIMGGAIALVALIRLLRRLMNKVTNNRSDSDRQ